MDAYHVEDWERGGQRAAAALVAALVGCALLSIGVWTFVPADVTVDGRPIEVPAGSTVSYLLSRHVTDAPAGDLLDPTGRVAAAGRGGEPRMTVDGRLAGPDTVLYSGAAVRSSRGPDKPERVVEVLAAVGPSVEETGTGPDRVMLRVGAAGLARVRRGEVSGSVVSSVTVLSDVPTIIANRPFPPGAKLVALTFDDGPWRSQTFRVLEILKSAGIRATFFMTGVWVNRSPDVAQRVAAEGHLLGNHTLSHANLGRSSPGKVAAEMAGGRDAIVRATGIVPHWFRAPGGVVTPVVRGAAAALGERIVQWTVDPKDWQMPGAPLILVRVVNNTQPGAVVLLHDGGGDRSQTIEALPTIIASLEASGYRFVTLDGLDPPPPSP